MSRYSQEERDRREAEKAEARAKMIELLKKAIVWLEEGFSPMREIDEAVKVSRVLALTDEEAAERHGERAVLTVHKGGNGR